MTTPDPNPNVTTAVAQPVQPGMSPAPAVGVDDDEISLLDIAETIAEHFRLLILGPLLVGALALGVSFVITPTFTARTMVLPPQAQQSVAASLLASLGALGGAACAVAGLKNPNDQFVALLKSRTIADRMIDEFDLMTRYKADRRDLARKGLESRTRISSGKDGLLVVEVDDHVPEMAARIANTYVQELSRLLGVLAVTEAQQRRMFFESQLKLSKDKLTEAEIALKTGGIESDILKASPEAAVTAVAQIQAQVAAQEVRLAAMRGYLTENAPEFKQALVELQALRAQLSKIETSAAPAAVLAGTVAPGNSGSPENYIRRIRDFKYYETLFELLAKQYEIARVDESREGAVIQIVDAAQPPEWKTKPKRALIAVIATLAAGFALLLFAFVRKALANVGRDEATAARLHRIRQLLLLRRPAP